MRHINHYAEYRTMPSASRAAERARRNIVIWCRADRPSLGIVWLVTTRLGSVAPCRRPGSGWAWSSVDRVLREQLLSAQDVHECTAVWSLPTRVRARVQSVWSRPRHAEVPWRRYGEARAV